MNFAGWGKFSPSDRGKPPYPLATSDNGEQPMADQEESPVLLIVEDDFFIATVVEEALGSAGFAVCGVAASADEAITLRAQTSLRSSLWTSVS